MINEKAGSREAFRVVVIVALSASLAMAEAATPSFTNTTDVDGLTFTQTALLDTPGFPMHAGGAVGDFNNDGWPDVFIVGGGGAPDKLFINYGGLFVDEAPAWFGAPENDPTLYRGVGANVGDYNGDGWVDIFVTSMGDLPGPAEAGKHRLWRNNGDQTFTNVATAAGVNETAPYPDGYGATFGDYDLDGDLDLWIGGWHWDGVGNHACCDKLGTRLFRNKGDGTFENVSASAGVTDTDVHGFGAIMADMDGDRYPELLVAGDFGTSRYFINNRDGTFTRHNPLLPGSTHAWNGMGTTVADINRNGRLDWFVTAIYPAFENQGAPGSRMYVNEGDHSYRSLDDAAGINDGGWGWGAAALDFDHDGWVDIVHTNGWPVCDPVTLECFTDEQTYLFRNNHDETFTETGLAIGLDHTLQGRGLMHLDYDQDGDMDVIVLANAGAVHLFRNDLIGPDTNWLQVVLDSSANPALSPGGWGAQVNVIATNGIKQIQRITGGSNYLSGSEWVAHFGLVAAASVDVEVIWADGFRTRFNSVTANQRITVAAALPLSHDPVVPGQPIDLAVRGLLPGEETWFAASLIGADDDMGPCPAGFGGLCTDLLSPVLLGSAIADADGTAVYTFTPGDLTGLTIYTQAMTPRGTSGRRSVKTNVVVDSF